MTTKSAHRMRNIIKALVNIFALVACLSCCLRASAMNSTYYLAPRGNDANSGTRARLPWRTPNHSVKCGDTIIAAAGSYIGTMNFNYGSWGSVTGTHPCVAFLKCVKAFACTVNGGGGPLMFTTASHLGGRS